MRIIKKMFFFLLGIVILLAVAGLFMSKEMTIEKEVVINKPRQEVFDYVKQVKNQDNYAYWNLQDKSMKKEYKGADASVGFVYAWDSEKMGQGEQEIKMIEEGKRLDMELRFKKPMEATNGSYLITEDAGPNQTKVKWGFTGKMEYPKNIMKPLMQMMLGNQLQEGLDSLKVKLEK